MILGITYVNHRPARGADAGIILIVSTVARIIGKTTKYEHEKTYTLLLISISKDDNLVPYRKRIGFTCERGILKEIFILVRNAP